MTAQFDKEQQETRTDDTQPETHKERGGKFHDGLTARQHHEQGGTYQYQARHHLTLQFGITEHKRWANRANRKPVITMA